MMSRWDKNIFAPPARCVFNENQDDHYVYVFVTDEHQWLILFHFGEVDSSVSPARLQHKGNYVVY